VLPPRRHRRRAADTPKTPKLPGSLGTPLAGYEAMFTTLSRFWKGRSAQFRHVLIRSAYPEADASSVGPRSDRRFKPASGTLGSTGCGFSLPFGLLRSAARLLLA
jgi:hypothetical protein